MSFGNWPIGVVLAGALALAAILALLQFLKTRRRDVRLANTPLFGRIAKEVSSSALFGRFRHILAFLLALLIVLLLWLAASGLRRDTAADGRFHILYLDASALMMPGDRFADAEAALIRRLETIPAAQRRVVLGDAFGSTLLEPGEDALLLPARLASYDAQATPSRFGDWLEQGPGGPPEPARTTIEYFGAAAAYADGIRTTALPPGRRPVAGYLAPAVSGNRGITMLGIAPAASGDWRKVDALVETAASSGAPPSLDDLDLSVGGNPLVGIRKRVVAPGRYVIEGIDADGGTLKIALRRKDGFAADDSASIELPDRKPVGVAVGPGVPDAIRRVIALDPSLEIAAPGAAKVAVKRDGDDEFAAALPTFFVTDPGAQRATFVATLPEAGDGANVGADSLLAQLGIAPVDSSRIASDLGRPVSAAVAKAPTRSISVWQPVFARDGAFGQSPALPLFISQSLHWLAGPPGWVPYARAGTMLPESAALFGIDEGSGLRDRRLNDAVFLPKAGRFDVGGRAISVALENPHTTRIAGNAAAAKESATPTPTHDDGWDLGTLLTILLLSAAVLLALEWRLFHRGSIP